MIVGKRNIFKATEVIQTGLKQGLVVLKREVISSNRTFGEFKRLFLLYKLLLCNQMNNLEKLYSL